MNEGGFKFFLFPGETTLIVPSHGRMENIGQKIYFNFEKE